MSTRCDIKLLINYRLFISDISIYLLVNIDVNTIIISVHMTDEPVEERGSCREVSLIALGRLMVHTPRQHADFEFTFKVEIAYKKYLRDMIYFNKKLNFTAV